MSVNVRLPRAAPGMSILAAFNALAATVERALNITASPPLEVSRTAGGTNFRLNGELGSGGTDVIFAYIADTVGQPVAEGDFYRYSWQELDWQGQNWAFDGARTGTLNAYEIQNRPVRPGKNVVLFPIPDGSGDYVFEAPVEEGFVRVTTGELDSETGMFQAYIQAIEDGSPPTILDSQLCWALGPNGGTPLADTRYKGTPLLYHSDGLLVYLIAGNGINLGCVSGQDALYLA